MKPELVFYILTTSTQIKEITEHAVSI